MRPISPQDRTDVVGVLDRAFADDPVWGWLLGDGPRSGPRRRRAMAALSGLFARRGAGWTSGDGHAVALWGQPKRWPAPLPSQLRVVPAMTRSAGSGERLRRMVSMQVLERHHPHEAHWYLGMLATDPDHQGTGLGSALLADRLTIADRDGLPTYLESSKEENVPFYGRFGFEVTERLELPRGGPPMWLMWRPARPVPR